MKSTQYWVIFSILTCGVGLITWLTYLIMIEVGLYDPYEPDHGLIKRFSTLHNLSMCVIIFYLIIAPALGWK